MMIVEDNADDRATIVELYIYIYFLPKQIIAR